MTIRILLVFIALCALPFLGGSSCMGKPCLDSNDCVRECRCSFTGSNEVCAIAYQCDYETEQCETQYNELSCDDICSTYATAGLCGNRLCSSDSNCSRTLDCVYLDTNGAEQYETCSHTFICDASTQLCEQNFTLTDESFCTACINGTL